MDINESISTNIELVLCAIGFSDKSFSKKTTFHPWQVFFLIIFLAMFTFANEGCKNAETKPLYAPPFDLEETGRHYDKISINPNGEDWTFSEFIENNTKQSESYILRFNLRTKHLYRYLTPAGYEYAFPNFSPKGNWIVAIRFPSHDNTYAQFQQSLKNGEIVMMRSDGSDFQVLSAPKGRYASPAMSPSETKIAYWRADTQRPPGSKTIVTNFDVYEYDIITKQSSLFSGPFKYYGVHDLQYIDEDTVLLGAIYPSPPPGTLGIDAKQYNYSEVYINKRGEKNLPDPSFMAFRGSKYASIDKYNNYYKINAAL